MNIIRLFFGGSWSYLVAIAGAFITIFGYTQKVKYNARKEKEEEIQKELNKYEKEQMRERIKHDEEISRLDDVELDDRLLEQSKQASKSRFLR